MGIFGKVGTGVKFVLYSHHGCRSLRSRLWVDLISSYSSFCKSPQSQSQFQKAYRQIQHSGTASSKTPSKPSGPYSASACSCPRIWLWSLDRNVCCCRCEGESERQLKGTADAQSRYSRCLSLPLPPSRLSVTPSHAAFSAVAPATLTHSHSFSASHFHCEEFHGPTPTTSTTTATTTTSTSAPSSSSSSSRVQINSIYDFNNNNNDDVISPSSTAAVIAVINSASSFSSCIHCPSTTLTKSSPTTNTNTAASRTHTYASDSSTKSNTPISTILTASFQHHSYSPAPSSISILSQFSSYSDLVSRFNPQTVVVVTHHYQSPSYCDRHHRINLLNCYSVCSKFKSSPLKQVIGPSVGRKISQSHQSFLSSNSSRSRIQIQVLNSKYSGSAFISPLNFVPGRFFSTSFTRSPCFVKSKSTSTSTSSEAHPSRSSGESQGRNTSSLSASFLHSSSSTAASSGSKMTSTTIEALSNEKLCSLKCNFLSDSKNVLAQNACARTDPIELCTSRAGLDEINHVFNNRIETEGKPITNQKSSGRCWLFAFLNCVRIPFMKHYNIDEFEFSQSYLFFYDKLERCHYFLHNVVETYERGERVDGRLISFLLQDPCSDGGQWSMVSNLVLRYGLMPKKNFQESFSSESTSRLNSILRSKLREFCKELRELMSEGKSKDVVQAKIDEQLDKIFRIISICLGTPKDQFTWEYYDKSKNYHKVGPITPLKFYEEYVKPVYKIDDKVCLVNDPREFHPYNKAYTIDCLGNVVGGSPTIYNNQHIDLLESVAVNSIKKGDPVWFGCEVVKRFAAKQGIEDLTIHDYSLVFGTDVSLGLTKAERLIYGESCMTHAMVFTACSVDDNGKVTKWRVENSWGDDRGEKGYFVMSADWFKEFVFELVVDKSLVPPEVMNVFDLEPTILPAWDPMGTLACKNCTGCSHSEF